MAAGRQSGVVDGIRYGLRWMHETGMELFFPRQRDAANSVLGKWEPKTPAATGLTGSPISRSPLV